MKAEGLKPLLLLGSGNALSIRSERSLAEQWLITLLWRLTDRSFERVYKVEYSYEPWLCVHPTGDGLFSR